MWDCSHCEGQGGIMIAGCFSFPFNYENNIEPKSGFHLMKCPLCGGTGSITQEQIEYIEIGNRVREHRVNVLGKTLRNWCKSEHFNPIDQSNFERGCWWEIHSNTLRQLLEHWQFILMGGETCYI